MENTLENKARFFAQYWDVKVFVCAQTSGRQTLKINEFSLKQIGNNHCYLELKKLSGITDEDAIEVSKKQVYRNENGKYSTLYDRYNNYIGESPADNIRALLRNSVYFDEFSIDIYDYLRSKGYALPYNGLSVEQQIEYNWIKLT